ncbi:MAG: penicillin-binding protein 1C [Syntrophobacteraceae bacterium CG07_land_8_20_14_0_80_61_8]|nr:MAG: penicillin-binding protein 1C [Syntrophobacteraceae bacterium CG07_land_8_20_14_0_80_61_8]
MSRRGKFIGFCLVLAAAVGSLGGWIERLTRIDPAALQAAPCLLVTDRHGAWLRFIPDRTGARHLAVPFERIPDTVKNAFLAAEDHNFWRHPGIDPGAMARAARDSIAAGRIVSGASTITQQVVRLLLPVERSATNKALELIRALRLERMLSKQEIFELYLNRVPLGNQLEGIEAAARIYFGRSCDALNAAEAAVLAALPKAPGRFNPYGSEPDRLLQRKNWVLGRMHAEGFLSAAELDQERRRAISFQPKQFPFAAPHFVDFVLARENAARDGTEPGPDPGGDRELTTTLDLVLQERVERVLASHQARLNHFGARQATAVVLDNAACSIAAMAGSIHYGGRHLGFNNGATALRSPGSALKPLLYAQALDAGFTTASILDDLAREYRFPGGSYFPANYDRRSYGPVTLREALANSFNLSAVHLLNRIGYQAFYDVLKRLDLINFPDRGPDYYGLGMVVGNPEVTLVQLAAAYAALANGGRFRVPTWRTEAAPAEAVRVFSEPAAFITADILSDPSARAITFARAHGMNPPYRVALKTGTSSRYRDGWTVGFTPAHTVAVWVGNFDGRPTAGLSGSSGAAPIVADILTDLYRLGPPAAFTPPPGLSRAPVCPVSGMKPGPRCPQWKEDWFITGTEPDTPCTVHRDTPLHHELPARFAAWVERRRLQGNAGRYRLEGAGASSDAAADALTETTTAGAADPARLPAAGIAQDAIVITQPRAGTRLLLDRRRSDQVLTLQAAVARLQPYVTWMVDDAAPIAVGPPYSLEWPLRPGRHRILAETPDHRSDLVEILVE